MTSLDEVRERIASLARDLDPNSRYRPELLAIVDASSDVDDFRSRLLAGCRGLRHAGASVFQRMTLEQQLRCNLITNETVLFRFSEGEWELLHGRIVPRFAATGGRILSAPCSHGEEAFSLAAACLQAGVDFSIDAFDIQPECVAEARTGRFSLGFPERWLQQPAVVGPEVLSRIRFAVGDLLAGPAEPGALPDERWDLVVCRNFLGYFVESVATRVALGLARRVAPGGALLVDSFCLRKFPGLSPTLAAEGLSPDGTHPIFTAAITAA